MSDSIAADESRQELIFQVPLSEIYKFNKPEKIKELAGAHGTDRQKPAALAPAKRFIISTIGIFCLILGLTGIFGHNPNIFSFLWLILGLAIVWVFLAKPEMDRKRAVADQDTKKDPEVTVVVNPARIVVHSFRSETVREWTEFVEYRKMKKGIHLQFLDGTTIWLPEETFYDKDEMKELVQLLQKKVSGHRSQIPDL